MKPVTYDNYLDVFDTLEKNLNSRGLVLRNEYVSFTFHRPHYNNPEWKYEHETTELELLIRYQSNTDNYHKVHCCTCDKSSECKKDYSNGGDAFGPYFWVTLKLYSHGAWPFYSLEINVLRHGYLEEKVHAAVKRFKKDCDSAFRKTFELNDYNKGFHKVVLEELTAIW